jgi:hypothetical protein
VCGRLIVEPPAIRQAAHNRLYLEQLALVDNPRLSRQRVPVDVLQPAVSPAGTDDMSAASKKPVRTALFQAVQRPMSDVPFCSPRRPPASPRQPKPGEGVWRLRKAAHVQSCELRNDSNLGAGKDVMALENGQPPFLALYR